MKIKISEDVGPYRNVDINSSFTHLSQKEMTGNSPGSSPTVNRRSVEFLNSRSSINEQGIQQQILQLKKQQQMQQQILLQHFQAQQQQLAEQHEQQLRQHLKYQTRPIHNIEAMPPYSSFLYNFHLQELLEKQREVEEREQRERRELERIESLKKKEKHEQSAVASSEVKQKLQGFLLNKKQREAAAASNSTSQGQFRSWNILQSEPNVASGTTPYCLNSLLGKFDDDFPLRKTASEPNLLRLRLKQRVYERRCSPIARKKDRLFNKKKSYLTVEASNSNSDSAPNSPPVVVSNNQISPSGGPNTPIQEEVEPPYGQLTNNNDRTGSVNDVPLYSSPSLPNISLGRPPSSTENAKRLAPVSEAEIRAAFTARLGMPLTGQLLPSTLPFYPTLPGIETVSEYSNPTSPAYIHKQMQALEQSRQNYFPSIYEAPLPITDSQVAHARLNKQGHRPLGRTQSAPLPLGHPMLTASSPNSLGVHYEDCNEQQAQQQQQQMHAHNYLKQQIRQTVLTRVGTRSQSHTTVSQNNKNEEEQEDDSITSEVIDLTGGRNNSNKNDSNGEQFPNQKQIRENMFKNLLQVNDGSSSGTSHPARPLARAFSSPLVAINSEAGAPSVLNASAVNHYIPSVKLSGSPHKVTTALAFDSLMLKHACICGNNSSHPEHGGRLQSVWARLVETGLVQRCDRVRSRKATLEELQTCHSEAHTLLFGTTPLNRQKLDANKLSELSLKSFVRLPCGGIGVDSDTTWNELHTAPAARMAVGCVIDLAFKAASGDIKNGFAIVRPPGHHAESAQAMGFCFFNSIAVAAKLLQQKLDYRRILIIDWDVHHGNGTQQIFYEDRRVLYLSIHRHDDGNFFPGTGASIECGSGSGLGYNVNVAWSGGLNPPMADAEYLAAFRTIVMPIAREYVPDIILVSAGFDAASGHPPPLGGYKVSPACFGFMTQQLAQLADGKVVLSLEGGYDLPAICDCSEECVRALLDGSSSPVSEEELRRHPCQNAIDTLQKTIAIQLSHWPVLKKLAHTVALSAVEAQLCEENEAISAMASLSMNKRNSANLKNMVPEISVEPMEEDEEK
ncbi:histone deacetylase 4 isoform X3 [Planococcus citri]|uniref:histone deacetylase 4 isoform X3 n=1 Tax=Planococcus citri TaxID=170843 RepID=UPI0031F832D5